VTTPAASGPLYASVADLRNELGGTDAGIGTPAQLSDAQLTQCLYSASNRISVYAGYQFDGSNPMAVPPSIFHDLCVDLAAFWAWKIYNKGKVIPPDHPVFVTYQNATTMLNDVRDGKIALGVGWAGGEPGPGQESALVINRIPPIFTGADSNTRIGLDGVLEDDVPIGQWTPRGADWLGAGGAIYQG
jgi:phage gp36-like protein